MLGWNAGYEDLRAQNNNVVLQFSFGRKYTFILYTPLSTCSKCGRTECTGSERETISYAE